MKKSVLVWSIFLVLSLVPKVQAFNESQRVLKEIAYSLQKEAKTVYYNLTYNVNVPQAADAHIRCKDFWEESVDYYSYVRSPYLSPDLEMQKKRVETLNFLASKVTAELKKLNYRIPEWEKCLFILKDLNSALGNKSTNNSGFFRESTSSYVSPYTSSYDYSSRKNVEGEEKESNTKEVSLGEQSTNQAKRFLWPVDQKIMRIKIICLEGKAIVNTLFVGGDKKYPVTRRLGEGDKIEQTYPEGKYVKDIAISTDRVENIFRVECFVEKN